LTVAYLEDRKGIDNLITAFIALNKVNTQLIIAGDGEARGKLQAMASGNENIVFTGHIDGAVKQDLYEAADIFVLPSHFETWGLVVNEAMHYGMPVIITDTMGATDLIHGNGIIIPAGDSEALLRALQQLVESREARYKMGKRSREIIRSVDLNASTAPFIEAIDYVGRRKKTRIFKKRLSQSKSTGRHRTFHPTSSRQKDPGGFQEQQKE
jgi:glycosyltransferase involved in cell wall biosynthesis